MPCAPPDQGNTPMPRDGQAAHFTPAEETTKQVDLVGLKALRDSIPYQEVSGADLVREMRNSRY